MPTHDPEWSTCQVNEACVGVRLDGQDYGCLNHTQDEAARNQWWNDFQETASLDARGLTVPKELLRQVLEHAPKCSQGHPVLRNAKFQRTYFADPVNFGGVGFIDRTEFEGARFGGDADFRQARFGRGTFFGDARFDGDALFVDAEFNGTANFGGAWFAGQANFMLARFGGDQTLFGHVRFGGTAVFGHAEFNSEAIFIESQFDNNAAFGQAIFTQDAVFLDAHFNGDGIFGELRFSGKAVFKGVRFKGGAVFREARFDGEANFRNVQFDAKVRFSEAQFATQARFDALNGGGHLTFDNVTFEGMTAVSGNMVLLSALNTRFEKRARMELTSGTEVDLAGTIFHESSLLASCRLVSLEETEVAEVTVADVDLGACRFRGAHHLDELRIEDYRQFVSSPQTWPWTRRQVIAEEHAWREHRYTVEGKKRKAKGWHPDACKPNSMDSRPLDASELQIAAIYRDLRKGREDVKDSPGAADFYYGEMEMRRHSSQTPWAERWILTVYWLVCGYALRTLRSLGVLALFILLGSVSLWTFGSEEQSAQESSTSSSGNAAVEIGWEDALLTSIEAVIFREPENAPALTTAGQVAIDVLRAAGPVLVVLAVLSLRGRVKR